MKKRNHIILPALIFSFLLIASILFAQSPVKGANQLANAMNCICAQMRSLMPPLAMLLVVFAALVYGAGRLMGSETGSKASGMAALMLVAAVLSILLSFAGPDMLRLISNQPGMANACDLTVCGTAISAAPAAVTSTSAPPPSQQPQQNANASPSSAPPAPLAPPAGMACSILDSPGGKYVLQADVTSMQGAGCFSIRADNITLDCNNHVILARSAGDGAGQYGILSNVSNTTILNCHVKDFQYGIGLMGAANATLRANEIDAFIPGGIGILVTSDGSGKWASDTLVQANYVTAQGEGIRLEKAGLVWMGYNNISSAGIGVRLMASSSNRITSNLVQADRSDGMRLEEGSARNIVSLNDVLSQGGDALAVENGSVNRIFNNTLIASTQGNALAYGADSRSNQAYYNDFISGKYFVSNAGSGNSFSTNAGGSTQGNHYAGAELGRLIDKNGDGFADGGPDYPYSSKVARARWTGSGSDMGPRMER